MRQVLAIFRKDVRRQWPRLAGALALTVLTGCVDSPDPAGGIANLLYLVWTACWVYIGASVIQQESLPGDRQYWLTRPYDWRKLLAAKVLFIILFAALPLIATKAAVLWANGTPPLRYAPAILSRSLAFTGAVGLLAGALAAVTGTLTQFLWGFLALAGLEAAAIALGVNYGGDWGAVAWIRSAMVEMLIAAAGVAVLLLQYRRRRTFVSRAILSVTALLVASAPFGSVWHGAWRLESTLHQAAGSESLPLTMSFDSAPRPQIRYSEAPLFPGLGREGFYLPIRVSGIPGGSGVLSQRVAVTLQGAGGRRWSSGWRPAGAVIGAGSLADSRLIRADGPAWQYLDVESAAYQAVKDAPVRLHVSIALMLLSASGTATMQGLSRKTHLSLDGICEAKLIPTFSNDLRGARGFRNVEAFCAWPQPAPERTYVRAASPFGSEDSYGLLTAGPGFFSVEQSAWRREAVVLAVRGTDPRFTIESWRTTAYLERGFDVSGIRLKDYIAPRGYRPPVRTYASNTRNLPERCPPPLAAGCRAGPADGAGGPARSDL